MRQRIIATKQRRTFARIPRDEPSSAFRIPHKVECPKCRGTGKRSAKKGHKADCACVACQPCKECRGTGRVEEENRGRVHRNVDVEFDEVGE